MTLFMQYVTPKRLLAWLLHYGSRHILTHCLRHASWDLTAQQAPQCLEAAGVQAGPVVERLAERITDADAGVRAALRALLTSAVLPGLGPGPLAPFLPLLMAHVSAGMTHLAAPIRRAPASSCDG